MSYLADAAEGVRQLLASHSGWSEPVQPTRDWIDFVELEKLTDTPRVACVPLLFTVERATRGASFVTATIDVIIQERVTPYTIERVDALVHLAEQIYGFFEDDPGRKLPNVPATINGDPTYPIGSVLDRETLQQMRAFVSVIRTEWQTLTQ